MIETTYPNLSRKNEFEDWFSKQTNKKNVKLIRIEN